MSAVLDTFILEHAPGPLVDVDPSLVRARTAFRNALDVWPAISDDRLTSAWTWDGKAVDVRYGFYRVLEIARVSNVRDVACPVRVTQQ